MSGYLEHALVEFERAYAAFDEPDAGANAKKHATITFGVAAITLDAARAETTSIPQEILSEQDQAIALVYAIRCCPAHDISEPKWLLNPKYRRSFTVDGLVTDLSHRNEEDFDFAHIGDPYCLRDLADYLRATGVVHPPA